METGHSMIHKAAEEAMGAKPFNLLLLNAI